MDNSLGFKIGLAIAETVLAIPVLGGLIVVSTFWSILPILFILHIVSLIIAKDNNKKINGNIVGIIGNCLAWIPLVGFLFHLATAIVLWVEVSKER